MTVCYIAATFRKYTNKRSLKFWFKSHTSEIMTKITIILYAVTVKNNNGKQYWTVVSVGPEQQATASSPVGVRTTGFRSTSIRLSPVCGRPLTTNLMLVIHQGMTLQALSLSLSQRIYVTSQSSPWLNFFFMVNDRMNETFEWSKI